MSGDLTVEIRLADTNQLDQFEITTIFNRPVTGFEQGDISVSLGSVVPGSFMSMTGGRIYTATIMPTTGASMIMIDIPADSAMDVSGMMNIAALQLEFENDTTAPTIMSIDAPASVNTTAAFGVTITFSEAVTDFGDVGDILVGSSTVGTITSVDAIYTAMITPDALPPSAMSAMITINIPAGVAVDVAGNVNTIAMQETVTFMPSGVAPTVTATSIDMTVMEGDTVMLTGMAMDVDNENSKITYEWTQTAPTGNNLGASIILTGADMAEATFTVPNVLPMGATPLSFRLTVTSASHTAISDVTFMAMGVNDPPIAMATMDMRSEVGTTLIVALDGTDSSDPEGQPLTYAWTATLAGETVSLSDANTATPTYTATNLHADGMLAFILTVSEMGENPLTNMAMATVNIVANDDSPTAEAGGAHTSDNAIGTQKVRSGVPIMLSGTATDYDTPPDSLTFQWTLISPESVVINGETVMLSKHIENSEMAMATYTPSSTPSQGLRDDEDINLPIGTMLTFELRVGDGDGDANNPIPTDPVPENKQIQIDRVIITISSPQEQTVTIVAEIARAFMSSTVTAISNRLLNAKSGAQVNTAAASWNESSDKDMASARALSRLSVGGDAQSMKAMLGNSDFQMPFGDAGKSAGGLAFWGSGAYSDLSGQSDNVQWDGNLSGFHIGIDRRIKRDSGGDALLGIALSSLSSEVDYSDGTNVDVIDGVPESAEQGNYEIAMTTLSPYIGWNRGGGEIMGKRRLWDW